MTVQQLELVQVNNNNKPRRKYGKYANNGGYAWCGKCGERKTSDMKRCDECNCILRHRQRNKVKVTCACGCGTTIDKYRKTDPYHQKPRKYIRGHQRKGVKISKDHHAKMIAGNKAKPRTQEFRECMRQFRLGKKHTDETKNKIARARLNQIAKIISKAIKQDRLS